MTAELGVNVEPRRPGEVALGVIGEQPGFAWVSAEEASDFAMRILAATRDVQPLPIGWWHRNVKDGQIHQHPANPGRGWSHAMHRLCEQVYPSLLDCATEVTL